ncbi:MAG: class I SAM-dependent methyltransferase [Candidatus Binatia bacterium]
MAWEIFEQAASRYDAWYTTARGQRVDLAERALLRWLLRQFLNPRSVVEIGCGTGHFTTWLTTQGLHVIGLDRSPAMITELHRREPRLPAILGDAHHLPLPNDAVDVVIFITTLEFLENPDRALGEAVRVARQGLGLVVLNRWSVGGLSRRWGSQARGTLLGHARDYSACALRRLLSTAAGQRLQGIRCTSTLFPDGLWRMHTRLPLGEVLGVAALLRERPHGLASNSLPSEDY